MSVSLEDLTAALASPRLHEHRGLGEPPFYILPYEVREAERIAAIRARLAQRLAERGVIAFDIDLYDLAIELLKERGLWERLLAEEAAFDKDELRETFQNVLDPETHLVPAIERAIKAAAPFDLLLLGGVGEVHPFIRSSAVLNNMGRIAGTTPVLLFFPGDYAQGNSGASLQLFGRIPNDRYYRATDIRGFVP